MASPPRDDNPLHDDIAFWLRLADLAVLKRVSEALRRFDLRPGLYAALLVIDDSPGQKQNEVGEALRVATSNLAVMMDVLANRGLIQRERVAGDTRSYSLTLTEAGVAMLGDVKAALAPVFAEFDRIMGDRREVVIGALADLAALDD